MGLAGCLIHAPYFHAWYKFIDARMPSTATTAVVAKVGMEVLAVGPGYLAGLMAFSGAFDGLDAQGIRDKVIADGPKAWMSALLILPASQFINFRFVPTTHRLLFMNGVSIVWNTILSGVVNPSTPPAPTLQEEEEQVDLPGGSTLKTLSD